MINLRFTHACIHACIGEARARAECYSFFLIKQHVSMVFGFRRGQRPNGEMYVYVTQIPYRFVC